MHLNRRGLLLVIVAFCGTAASTAFAAIPGVNSTDGAQDPGAGQKPLTLDQISRMDPARFAQALPQLRRLMAQPKAASVADSTLAAIAGHLRQTPESTPGYWAAVLQYLEFASASKAPHAPPPGQKPRALSDILFIGIMRGIRENGRTILFDSGNLSKGDFINCRIIFTATPVQLRQITFNYCAFEFPVTDAPGQYLQKMARLLLASNLATISIAAL